MTTFSGSRLHCASKKQNTAANIMPNLHKPRSTPSLSGSQMPLADESSMISTSPDQTSLEIPWERGPSYHPERGISQFTVSRQNNGCQMNNTVLTASQTLLIPSRLRGWQGRGRVQCSPGHHDNLRTVSHSAFLARLCQIPTATQPTVYVGFCTYMPQPSHTMRSRRPAVLQVVTRKAVSTTGLGSMDPMGWVGGIVLFLFSDSKRIVHHFIAVGLVGT